MKIKKDVYRIDWIDSCASNLRWVSESDFVELDDEPIKIISYGVIIADNKDYIALAHNYGINPQQFCSVMSIPKGCIQSSKIIDTIEFDIKDNNNED